MIPPEEAEEVGLNETEADTDESPWAIEQLYIQFLNMESQDIRGMARESAIHWERCSSDSVEK